MYDFFGMIKAFCAAVNTVAGRIVAPILDENRAQKEREAHEERVEKIKLAISEGNVDRLARVVDELLQDAGRATVRRVESGPFIRVGMEHLLAILTEVSESIMYERLLNSMTEAAKQAAKK